MTATSRIAVGVTALILLAGCGPVPSGNAPVPGPSPVATTTGPASPSDPATTSEVPTVAVSTPTAAPPAAPAAAPATDATACAADQYRNVDGNCVERPVPADQPPAGATAQCNDGTYSFSQHRSGTCSHHGGVRRWL